MKNRDIAMEWFKMADLDFNSAKFLLNMRPMPLVFLFPTYLHAPILFRSAAPRR